MMHIFDRYGEIFEDIFSDGGCPSGVTDEFVLCLALNELGGYNFTNGAFNHCAAADQQDMKLIDGVLVW